jgi:hypothetical protein
LGVTIHYSGTLINLAEKERFLKEAATLAAAMGWEIEADADSKIGVTFLPSHDCEPLEFNFDENGSIESWVKTQFAGAEVHIQIIDFLAQISSHFSALTIDDEEEFWETHNQEILQDHFDQITAVLEDMRMENPGARGPLRMENRRIVDLIK